jgi:hypothetical protein
MVRSAARVWMLPRPIPPPRLCSSGVTAVPIRCIWSVSDFVQHHKWLKKDLLVYKAFTSAHVTPLASACPLPFRDRPVPRVAIPMVLKIGRQAVDWVLVRPKYETATQALRISSSSPPVLAKLFTYLGLLRNQRSTAPWIQNYMLVESGTG